MSPAVVAPPSVAAFVAAPAAVFTGERPRPSAVAPVARPVRLGGEAPGRRPVAAAEEAIPQAGGDLGRGVRRAAGDEVAVAFGDGSLLYLAQRLAQEGADAAAAQAPAARIAYGAAAARGRIEFGLDAPVDLVV